MNKYSIKSYEQGFEEEQARIGFEVASSWLWPLAHDEQDLKRIYSQSNFDPESSWYCFDGNNMVGFISMSLPSHVSQQCTNYFLGLIPTATDDVLTWIAAIAVVALTRMQRKQGAPVWRAHRPT